MSWFCQILTLSVPVMYSVVIMPMGIVCFIFFFPCSKFHCGLPLSARMLFTGRSILYARSHTLILGVGFAANGAKGLGLTLVASAGKQMLWRGQRRRRLSSLFWARELQLLDLAGCFTPLCRNCMTSRGSPSIGRWPRMLCTFRQSKKKWTATWRRHCRKHGTERRGLNKWYIMGVHIPYSPCAALVF